MTEETTAMLTKKGLRASLLARRKQLFESLALDNGLAERFWKCWNLLVPKASGFSGRSVRSPDLHECCSGLAEADGRTDLPA